MRRQTQDGVRIAAAGAQANQRLVDVEQRRIVVVVHVLGDGRDVCMRTPVMEAWTRALALADARRHPEIDDGFGSARTS
jgi:hypothetical protein